MIKLLLSGAALATFLAPSVLAQQVTASQTVELVGRAEPACVARAPAAVAGTNASFDPSEVDGGEIRIRQLVDSNSAEPLPTSITLAIPVVCNSSHRVTLRSLNGGLLRDTGDRQLRQTANGFGEFVPYEVAFQWDGQQTNSSSENVGALAFNVPRGAAGDATFRFALAGGGGALIAGRYSDSIIIEFVPSS